jgi:PmbA protein
MLEPDVALDRLEALLAAARAAGADAADALYIGSASQSVGVRKGALEDATRSEAEDIGLRVFLGARSAQVATADLSPPGLIAAAERAVAMARVAPDDPHAGLADPARLAVGPFPDLALFDPEVAGLSPDRLRSLAIAAEGSALAVPGIRNSEGGTASAGHAVTALATSTGFRGAQRGSSVSVSAVVIAGEGDAMQRDYDWAEARFLADLESPEIVGRSAGDRTVARLHPTRLPTGRMPVLFDSRVSASLLSHLVGAMSGPAIARRTSFLLDREGAQLFGSGVRVMEEPMRPRGLRSRPFDGEGLATRDTLLVDDGRIGSWLLDSASARQLGREPTGHASRGIVGALGVSTSNLHLAPGSDDVDALMADIRLGFLVTELIGMGVNGLTGDYSRGASGFAIREGRIAEPVTEVTIAGNLLDMYRTLVPANDLVFRHATNAPTVRIDGMMVAGA